MEKTTKKKWVEALRSGEYKQVSGILRAHFYEESPKHCCLGVLCDIVNPDGWVGNSVFKYGEEEISGELPKALRKKLEIHPNTQRRLIDLNDTVGASFDEIADWIEEHM